MVIAVGLAACGGEEVVVPVTLNLDSLTCGTNSASQVMLGCNTAVGAWVRRGDPADPDTSDEACIDFASDGKSLADLPAILSDSVDLSGISAGDVWLEIGVYGPASASDGCPEVSAVDDRMIAYGRTYTTEISRASHGLTLILVCYAVDTGANPDTCEADCEEAHAYCPCSAESSSCDLISDDCYNACAADDDPCYAACDADWNTCIEDQPTPCDSVLEPCLDECNGDLTCENACYDDYDDCVAVNCETANDICVSRCRVVDDATCASST